MMVKMKSMFAIGFAFTSLLSMFNSIFDGKVVAKLPFTPISWLQGLSHRNILGNISFIYFPTCFLLIFRETFENLLVISEAKWLV